MKCSIYENRPEVCKNFPTKQSHINSFRSCSYTFNEKGERIGDCNQCGECCMSLHANIHKLDDFIPRQCCPYLKE